MSHPLQDIIEQAPDWKSVGLALVHYRIETDQCFSSGEIARDLRLFRPDLVFGVGELGAFLRNQHQNKLLLSYDDGFGDFYPVKVMRTTQGHGRTPAGVSVVIYGRDQAHAQQHDFEVDIPPPGGHRQAWLG